LVFIFSNHNISTPGAWFTKLTYILDICSGKKFLL
jgi:hypothetical protein